MLPVIGTDDGSRREGVFYLLNMCGGNSPLLEEREVCSAIASHSGNEERLLPEEFQIPGDIRSRPPVVPLEVRRDVADGKGIERIRIDGICKRAIVGKEEVVGSGTGDKDAHARTMSDGFSPVND